MAETRHGYLVLADISGYTGYLAQVELEHAQEILTDLLECIVEKFKTALTISTLEGDAVFANVDEADIPRPESLLELIETTYVEFRRRRDSSLRSTTCQIISNTTQRPRSFSESGAVLASRTKVCSG